MRRILAGLAVVGMLMVASPAQATPQGASEARLTPRNPIVMTQVDTNGYVNADVWHYGDGKHGDDFPNWTPLTVEITDSTGAVLATGTCDNVAYVQQCHAFVGGLTVPPPTEPQNAYTVTVSVASGTAYQVVVHTDE